jgi:hypothetical protein
LVDQLLGRYHPARVQQQDCEQRPLLGRGHRHPLAIAPDFQRAEDPKLYALHDPASRRTCPRLHLPTCVAVIVGATGRSRIVHPEHTRPGVSSRATGTLPVRYRRLSP